MKYTSKKFQVGPGIGETYRNNYEATFGKKNKKATKKANKNNNKASVDSSIPVKGD